MSLYRLVVAIPIAFACAADAADGPQKVVRGLNNPESATVGPDGRVYVSEIGTFDQAGDGHILVINEGGEAASFVEGLDDPKGLASWNDWLFVADRTRVLRIDRGGRHEVIASVADFPRAPHFLNDVEVDEAGHVYVSDSGNLQGSGGAIYRLDSDGKVTEVEVHGPGLGSPNGLLDYSPDHMLVVDLASGSLYRLVTAGGEAQLLSGGYGGGDGLARDSRGRIYVSDYQNGRVFMLDDMHAAPRLIAKGFESAADIALAPNGDHLLVPDMKAGELAYLPLPD
jgi:sugar lactone lactonase YvrE